MRQFSAPEELLFDYATGAAPEPVALAIATHLDLSPASADMYARLNALGGALLDRLPTSEIEPDGLTRTLARLDQEAQAVRRLPTKALGRDAVPAPIAAYVGDTLERLHWRSLTSGVEEHVLPINTPGYRASLLRIAPGKSMPEHTHRGDEITVVLEGAYDDCFGRFERGAIEVADPSVEHQPISDSRLGCLCLAVLSAPLRLTGRMGWLINPFLRF
jgi:putative transcriptional regulator